MGTRINWNRLILEALNMSKSGKLHRYLGSPKSAQVTRVRLLRQYNHIKVRTEGAKLIVELVRP